MAEGIEETHIDEHDVLGKKIGILAAVLAVLLSIFTISAHRAHTETIELQNDTNDQWAHYQAKRIRGYQIEMNSDLLQVLPQNAATSKLMNNYKSMRQQYTKELEDLKKDAENSMQKNIIVQKQALCFDFSEGMLEISLVLSSLYFISRKKLFPILGCLFGCIGLTIGIYGFLL